MGNNTAAETSSPQLAAEDSRQNALREAFVEMLFALAVAQVAIHAADLVKVSSSLGAKMPAFAHLFLALMLIAASWVGWRGSRSPGMQRDVESIFSIAFIGLLVDVFLVVIYFIIVRQVDIEQKGDSPVLLPPSAVPEALLLLVVFVVYAVWDLVTDVFSPGCIPHGLGARAWISKTARLGLVSTIASDMCIFFIGVAYCIARRTEHRHDSTQVVLIDVALLLMIFFFRAIKAVENPLSRWFRITDCEAFRQPRAVHGNEIWLCIAILCIYGAALGVGMLGT